MSRERRNYTPEEKVAILKRHLVEKVPVSDLCDELGLNPTVFYGWQKQLFENGAAAFEKTRRRQHDPRDQKIARLEAKLAQKNEMLAELMQKHVQLKKNLGNSEGAMGVPHDHAAHGARRDQVVDFVGRWSQKTELAIWVLVLWLGISLSKFYDWRKRYGKVNEHHAQVPRDHWLTEEEKQAILEYQRRYPVEGYRRLAFRAPTRSVGRLDDDVVAASPATVYRVVKAADRLGRPSPGNERKGKGFHQPERPHQHWHIDFSHVNIGGTFYHLCSILDGYSRLVVHWEIRETMLESDAEIVGQRAREKFAGENPRIISDHRFAAVPAGRNSSPRTSSSLCGFAV